MNAPAPNCRADPTPAVRPSLAPTLAAGAGPRPSLPPPTMSLRALLDQAGSAVLAGLPARAWVEASVTAVPGAHGHAMELADAGRGGAADPAQLRAFLARDALKAIGRESGASFDPTLLTGMTVCLLLAPSFSARWHLSARILGLSAETRDSLARRAVDQFRRELRASGHYDRQRALPGPPDVIRIAIVTPSGAAGHADIAVELERWQAAGAGVGDHPHGSVRGRAHSCRAGGGSDGRGRAARRLPPGPHPRSPRRWCQRQPAGAQPRGNRASDLQLSGAGRRRPRSRGRPHSRRRGCLAHCGHAQQGARARGAIDQPARGESPGCR